jgi:hypothetical protein
VKHNDGNKGDVDMGETCSIIGKDKTHMQARTRAHTHTYVYIYIYIKAIEWVLSIYIYGHSMA